jgi:hypothetical protein
LANLPQPLVKWRDRTESISAKNRREQSRQRESLSIAHLQQLLGSQGPASIEWLALNKLLFASAGEPSNLVASEVHCGLGFARDIQRAFYERYRFAPAAIHAHRRFCCRMWGKHMLALACRGNGSRDLPCRLTLLAQGVRLLVDTAS